MATISSYSDIFVLNAPGKKEGDIVEILDENNDPHKVRLTIPMGDAFSFVWADALPPQQTQDEGDGRFVLREDGSWVIQTTDEHAPGDKIRIKTKNGIQVITLGAEAGENQFYRPNHFRTNPEGGEPKWCVQVYHAAKSGDVVDVIKKDGTIQKQRLTREITSGVWVSAKMP